jgi:hypothetical protein
LIQGMHDVIQKYPGVLGDVSLLEEYFLIGPNGPNDAEEANSLIPCNGSPQRCYSMILDLFPRYGRVFFLGIFLGSSVRRFPTLSWQIHSIFQCGLHYSDSERIQPSWSRSFIKNDVLLIFW